MSRYIDADKLIERLMHSPLFLVAPKNSKDGIIDLIVSRPTADVVEVVRCKDCRHQDGCNQYVLISGDEGELAFCSYGAKKT